MVKGGCLCGAVRYEAEGEPLFALRCYCRDCQRASGSSNVPIMAVLRELFKITGETTSFTTKGGSGHNATRNFCPICGSLLFGATEAAPDIVTLYAGTLDDPSQLRPAYIQFSRNRPNWESQLDVPEFETGRARLSSTG